MKKCDCDFCSKVESTDFEEMYESAVWELQAANLYIKHLLSIIDEIQELNKDMLIDKLIENWLERHHLDKLCHSRVLFDH